jgi:hypothetical protein
MSDSIRGGVVLDSVALSTLAEKLYTHWQELRGTAAVKPAFSELGAEAAGEWVDLAGLAWRECTAGQPSAAEEELRRYTGIEAWLQDKLDKPNAPIDFLVTMLHNDSLAFDQVVEHLTSSGMAVEGMPVTETVGMLLDELANIRALFDSPGAPVLSQPAVGIIARVAQLMVDYDRALAELAALRESRDKTTASLPTPKAPAPDALVLPPRMVEALCELVEGGGVVRIDRAGVVEAQAVTAQHLTALHGQLEVLRGCTNEALKRTRQLDRCNHKEGTGTACLTERRDFENPLWSCGWKTCPHKGGQP